MHKTRLEAFSDGVFAILITILVLELKAPHGANWDALSPLWPKALSYALSFVYLGIYWNNHHHLMHLVQKVSGGMLWANLHLLFWLSLVSFATAWMGENHFAALPTALYGAVLLAAALSYFLLVTVIKHQQGPGSVLAQAVGKDWKGKVSPLIYAASIPLSFVSPALAMTGYVAVALLWLVPDRRIERQLN
ncbi:putative membrane protein [Inhella inkyongensis]|uniref:Putative membrane protein n=1 Tax=Inhella inkyongensis TaxID=392593 RepID=A0A840RWR7_9BURK|nr:TMEM175 family protein [Inhella inkyongensis]MBB5203147.1 putative membrane protein [Inhella inkyongensis]